ncbi:MAG TPA: copper amine oxidase N-terminal domain-containing protein [Deinococcales bacterium]|nr:copper amine oxidase N-terminal domain-containing protein [Deinococcales bacterium]
MARCVAALLSLAVAVLTAPASAQVAAPAVRPVNTIQDSRLTVRQLLVLQDGGATYLNGQPVQLTPPPRLQAGRTLLPLRETARVLGLTVEPTLDGMRLGSFEVSPNLPRARVSGRDVPFEEYAAVVDGVTFVTLKALSDGLGATVAFDPVQRVVTITLSPVPNPDPTLPVARFTTDKREYRLGEPVKVIDFSFDPDGLPLTGRNFRGREDAFFTPGEKAITLTVTNSQGRTSLPFVLRVRVTEEVFATPKEYALRFLAPGRAFQDETILSYPLLQPLRLDDASPLIVSDSPETPDRSGLLYEDSFSGNARVLAHHINGLTVPARVVLLLSNLDPDTNEVRVTRLGETAATRIVSILGQGSLLDYLTSSPRESLRLAPTQAAPAYLSPPLAPGQGINLMLDLASTRRTQLSVFMVEDGLLGGESRPAALATMLRALPVLSPDGRHVRGTFQGTTRRLVVDLARVPLDASGAARLVIGDGVQDPMLPGRDAITGTTSVLPGNYGLEYQVSFLNAAGTVAAFSARGGLYSGVVTLNGEVTPVPPNGVLTRPDWPLLLYRQPFTQAGSLELSMVPASGSNLPISIIVYRLPGPRPAPPAATPGTSTGR